VIFRHVSLFDFARKFCKPTSPRTTRDQGVTSALQTKKSSFSSGDPRNPMTGISCCARAVSGNTTAEQAMTLIGAREPSS
jgi:hypothetical protein